MATEELLLVINDAQLRQALTQINIIKSAQTKTVGQVTGLTSLIAQTRRDARAAGLNLDDLPTLNRDLRIIGGLLPGFREASVLLFQARRGVLAGQRGREAAAVAELDPALAAQLGQAALIGQVALVVAAVGLIVRAVDQNKRAVERNRSNYENLFRVAMGITHDEYESLSVEVKGFASRRDEFEQRWEQSQKGEAISKALMDFITTAPFTGPAIRFDPLAPRQGLAPLGAIDVGKWLDNIISETIESILEDTLADRIAEAIEKRERFSTGDDGQKGE